jgi:Peptidase family M28
LRRPLLIEGLLRTLEDLAAIGDKRAGSEGAQRAAGYLHDRFVALELSPRIDRFHFPRHETLSSILEVELDGQSRPFSCEVLEASGAGRHKGPIKLAGRANDLSSFGNSLQGALAMVERDTLLHRSTQYQNLITAGAAAMLMASAAPGNLHQLGSIRRAWEAHGAIPALSLGARDARILREAINAGQPVHAALDVAVRIGHGVGQNVIGRIDGERPEQIVIGAHYDTWYIGSTDNGAGVAALLELAARWRPRARPPYALTFVAWDGEELALYGGYDFLRRHVIVGREPILAVLDLETPSSHGAEAYGLARSSHAAWERPVESTGAAELFVIDAPMALVPELFGGVIPTDIQGLYRAGTPVLSTAGDGPYYHTVEDTPDKVDLHRLAELVEAFDRLLLKLVQEPLLRFAGRDSGLWHAEARARFDEGTLAVEVVVRDASSRAQAGAEVTAVLFHDHFHESATRRARSNEDGRVTLRFDGVEPGAAPRFVHVTAGRTHPLVETVISLD